jgi:hypothetical protein
MWHGKKKKQHQPGNVPINTAKPELWNGCAANLEMDLVKILPEL